MTPNTKKKNSPGSTQPQLARVYTTPASGNADYTELTQSLLQPSDLGNRTGRRRFRNQTTSRNLRLENSRKTRTNLCGSNKKSEILSHGHNREATLGGFVRGSSLELMRRRTDQSGQRSLYPVTLHASDSHQRVRHGGSEHIKPIRRIRCRMMVSATVRCVFVKTATKRPRMRRRRAHTRLLSARDRASVVAPDDVVVSVGRDRAVVDGESDGGGGWSGGVEVDTGGRGRPLVVMVVLLLLMVVVVVVVLLDLVAEEGRGWRREACACGGSEG